MLSGDGFPEAGTFPEKVLRSKPRGTKVKRTAGQAAVRPAGQPVNQSTGQPDNQSTSPAHRGGEKGSLFTQELATSRDSARAGKLACTCSLNSGAP